MKISKKIVLYGGTFDPIHFGHLNLAMELMEKEELEEVWFVPTLLNPLKITSPPTTFAHRLAMVKLAIKGIPYFKVKDIEKNLPTPSYTLQTLQALLGSEKTSVSKDQFYLLLGEDAVPGFMRWNSPEKIVDLIPLLIGSRSETSPYDLRLFSPKIQKAIEKGMIETSLMDISASCVRERIARGLSCSHLVPANVLSYIKKNHLYLPNSSM